MPRTRIVSPIRYTLLIVLLALIALAMKADHQVADARAVLRAAPVFAGLGESFAGAHRTGRTLEAGALAAPASLSLPATSGYATPSFSAATDFGAGINPQSVAVGDFNGDGKLDMAVANFNSNTVSILLGLGTGSFGAKTDFGTGSGPRSVALGDFNGDGKLDLAVANDDSNLVSILLGLGTGSFGAKTDFGTGSRPYSVAVGDFNGDGKLDMAVANISSSLVSILLGTGTGSFGAKTDFGTGSGPISVAVGDFNGDGKLDLAVANFGSSGNSVSILLGLGTGSFGAKTDFGTGSQPYSVAVGDFNGDGNPDLAVATRNSNTVSILLGTGAGSFGAKTDFGTGSFPFSVAVGDFNGDGKLDLAVANADSNSVSILPGTGTGSFGAKTDFGTGSAPYSVAVGDFNGDGKLDLAVANGNSATVSILLNTTPIVSAGVFCPKTDFGTGNNPYSVAVGDFNGDGKPDLALANENSNTVSILLGTGTGSFGAKTDFGTGSSPRSVAVGDFNGDGKLDLVVANDGSNLVSILLGTGTGSFGAKTDFGTGVRPNSVAVGDFNGDGKLDLAVANIVSNLVSILLGTGTGSFGAKTDFGTGSGPISVAVGDFNGDGKLDLAVANFGSSGNSVSILLGLGTGSFGAKTDFGTGSAPRLVAVGDFNGDGKLDLAVANRDSNNVSILPGTGTGSFGAKTDFGTGSTPFSVAVGDFNGDGKLDLAVANGRGNSVSILPGLGTGSFGARSDFGTGSLPNSVAVGDFNGDGKLDLAVANFDGNTVSILLGGCDSPPNIAAIGVTRTAGSPSANSQIATATDAEDAENVLQIQVSSDGMSFGDTATLNGMMVTLTDQNAGAPNINPNATGQAFADVVAACTATSATFTLQVTDSVGLVMTSPFTVTVNANTPPVLSYATQMVTGGTTPMFNPATGPSDNVAVSSIALQSVTPMTGLTLSMDNATGKVMVTSASLAGSYTVVIRASDNCAPGAGTFTDATFTVNVVCPTITLSALPNGTGGSFYDQTVTASPAGGNYTFMLTGGNVPPGLSFNGATGSLSGTPTIAGTYTFDVKATGFGTCTNTQTLTLVINCPAITLSPATLPNATTNTAYPQTITASPAGGNYTFAVTSGMLQAGLTLNSNGSFSGAPTQSGTFNFRVTATGFGGCTGFRDYSIVVTCPTITLSPASLPGGSVGTAYSQTVAASPAGSYAYSVSSGALPTGLMLNPATGAITGTPTASGSFNFTITASVSGCTGSQAYTVTITCPTITLASPIAAATAGVAYSASVAASPAGTYTYSIIAGNLPSGLTLNPSTGAITGTPTITGTYNFTIKADASDGCSGQQTYMLVVGCPTVIVNPASLPNGSTSTPYSQSLSASPATGSYTFTVSSGGLPTGLNLNAGTGVISGTPSVNGTYNFSITATGFGSCASAPKAYAIVIGGGGCPTITLPSSLPNGTVGQLYSNSVAASPADNYNYTATGTLPPGVTLFSSFGLIFGFPTSPGTYNFTVTATLGTCTASQPYTVIVGAGVVPPVLQEATVGKRYTQHFNPLGLASGVSFSVASGKLPEGITLTAMGLLSGAPSEKGSFLFTLRAADAVNTALNQVVLKVNDVATPAVSGSIVDPLNCTRSGSAVNVSATVSNTSGATQTATFTATLPAQLLALPGSCATNVAGFNCSVTNASTVTATGTLTNNQSVTITYQAQIADGVPAGAQVCVTSTASFAGAGTASVPACTTLNCPTLGAGQAYPAASLMSDQKAGSVLIYNIYTSATDPTRQNTRLSITNTDPARSISVHLFFVDGSSCSVADSYLCLTQNQTTSFLASDLDPGTTGYVVAIATDANGCPTNFNFLIGDEYVKFSSGHAANLSAEAIAALPGGLAACNTNSTTAAINFDGISYNTVPRVLAVDNVGSRADGNDTLLILNRIGGNLATGASTLGTVFGILYDDSESGLSFSVTGSCQLRNSLSNTFPRTTPRFENFIPAGRSGWLKVFSQSDIGLSGSVINFNPNAATTAGAFNQGHNLHTLTNTSAATYSIPVFPPGC